MSFTYRLCKRIFDIVCSVLGLLVASPIFIVAVIGILISDPGPILYVADRVGYKNRHFKMYKFRSMRVDKEANENNFKADTNRIFSFGAFMRDTKIDELPQLINLLKGDMSIVGPRPASSDQVGVVRKGKYAACSSVKPGLTSPSALYDYIYGDTVEDEKEYEDKVLPTRLELDLYYVNNANMLLDIKTIFDTALCIIKQILKISLDKKKESLISLVNSPSKKQIPSVTYIGEK